MWSEIYHDYVEELVLTNRAEYPYYVAHTCSYWGTSSSASQPSFKVYFSKEPITASSLYSYRFTGDSVCYSVVGGNASTTYSGARVTVTNYSGNLTINNYEFIYSNAEYSTQTVMPDIIATNAVTQAHFDGVSLIVLCVMLGAVVVGLFKR